MRASKDRHRFLVGTCSLHDSNQLSVLEYAEDSNHLETTHIYSHPDQIMAVESSPNLPYLCVTSHQNNHGNHGLTLWKLPKQVESDFGDGPVDEVAAASSQPYHISPYTSDALDLEEVTVFNQSQKIYFVHKICWNHKKDDSVLTADNKILTSWTIRESSVQVALNLIHLRPHILTISFALLTEK
jgi:hypothetical protein